jgi:Zn-dependent M28 family amino/carboxypeptidase
MSAQNPPAYVDPQIKAALAEISAAQIQSDIEKLVSFQTRSTLSAQDPAAIAANHGIGAAREWIQGQFEIYSRECAGCLEVKTDSFTQPAGDRIPSPTEITNVYAVLSGTNPEDRKRIVLVSGHYDSRNSNNDDRTGIAPGANDDASGTVVSLECARVLSKLKFPATIIFLTVAGEEQGLYGSKHFAEMARKKGWAIEAVLNNDIVGGDQSPQQDAHTVRVFSEGIPAAMVDPYQPPASTTLEDEVVRKNLRRLRVLAGENDSSSRELARYISAAASIYQPGVVPLLEFRPDRYLRGGDHSSFNDQGFAAVRFTEFREDFKHQHQNVRTENGMEYGDLPKFVNFEYVANVARVNAATLAALAAAPATPQNVQLETKELTNDSTLHWDAPADGRAAGYEILWRATSAPDWENSKQVNGSATRTTVRLSKDNVIFAVESVDEAGHRSLPVGPTPER